MRATAGRGGSSRQRGSSGHRGQFWAEREESQEGGGGSDGGTKLPAPGTSGEENMFTDPQ